jgi:hypothetical protein
LRTSRRSRSVTEKYWTYENWIHKYARVHLSQCAHCNVGLGSHGASNSQAGRWIDKFENFDDAMDASQFATTPCGHCVPGIGTISRSEITAECVEVVHVPKRAFTFGLSMLPDELMGFQSLLVRLWTESGGGSARVDVGLATTGSEFWTGWRTNIWCIERMSQSGIDGVSDLVVRKPRPSNIVLGAGILLLSPIVLACLIGNLGLAASEAWNVSSGANSSWMLVIGLIGAGLAVPIALTLTWRSSHRRGATSTASLFRMEVVGITVGVPLFLILIIM